MQEKAYRIVGWWRYEVLKNKNKAVKKTKMQSLMENPLIYVRFYVNADIEHNHILPANYRKLLDEAGPELTAACDGLYKILVGMAGNQVKKYRGWVLDDWQRPMDQGQIAKFLCLSKGKVSQIFEILMNPEVNFVEFSELPESLRKSLKGKDLTVDPKSGINRNNQENLGSPFIEVETEGFSKDKTLRLRNEAEEWECVQEKLGMGESQGDGVGEENVQPQPRPPAQASVSGSDTVPVSASEKISDSDSVPDSVSVSAPGPGAGAGAAGAELTHAEVADLARAELDELAADVAKISRSRCLTKGEEFIIEEESREVAKDTMTILGIDLNNASDTTTISDIYKQLAVKVSAGSPHPLFEISLNKARTCRECFHLPIAGFVTAMKRLPFRYVPRKRGKT